MKLIEVSTDKHIEAVGSLARAIWTEHYTPIIGRAQVDYMVDKFQSRQAVAQQIHDGYRYFLIEDEDRYCGYLGIQPKGEELFLSKIYVETPLRGKGFGRKCLAFIEDMARNGDFTAITLTVNKNNVNSIAAYERWGFAKVEAIVQDIGGGFVMDDYKMAKTVGR
jgi:ribosomal protein S18 acetylase RimI-like enzyme